MGSVTSPKPNALLFEGDSIDFSYKRASAPGFVTKCIDVNLNTNNSTFVLAKNLTSSAGPITGTFKIPNTIFYYLGPSGAGPASIQVTEYQTAHPDQAIFPPATPIRLRKDYPLVPGSPGAHPSS
ncbi:hypothetical protein RQP46_008200 [Phenoliferia psychrophenolica]